MIWAVSLLNTKLIPRILTPGYAIIVFGVSKKLEALFRPLVQTVLYPYDAKNRGWP